MHVLDYFSEVSVITQQISHHDIQKMAEGLADTRLLKGKVYIIGMGGSIANAIHMAADLRKLCDVDAEAFDNIAELTARANDEGLDTIFTEWLSRGTVNDELMVLSVGGGTSLVSTAICRAIDKAREREMGVMGIVGPDGGYTMRHADICVNIPVANDKHVTPHTEAFQMVVVHCLVSHPLLQVNKTKW
jgi:D-sedoheptulose 7-phosphate isomerase